MAALINENPDFIPENTPPEFTTKSPALCLHIHGQCGQARASTMFLPHGEVKLPIFMPVGTKGTIKGLTSQQLEHEALSPQIILGNTYHLALQPGTDILDHLGGLHKFMNWPHNLLTDSGGFQMVSLLELAEITEEGVNFKSSIDGRTMMLKPEDSIHHQNNIGSDIMMQLDDVVSSISTDMDRFAEASDRTLRWLDRCISANRNPEKQNLFGIVQGGLDTKPGGLREANLKGMIARDLPGYAIGGLAGGEEKDPFWRVVFQCTTSLPKNKPRYLMGVGYPLDLVVCVALGVDMFDCVYPTRTARFGVALTDAGIMKVKNNEYSCDHQPIDSTCKCLCCNKYSRSDLHSLFKLNDSVACQMITMHNLAYMLSLSRRMRLAIMNNNYPLFVRKFLEIHFNKTEQKKDQKNENKVDKKTEENKDDSTETIDINPIKKKLKNNQSSSSSSSSSSSFSTEKSLVEVPVWVEEALEAAQCNWRHAQES
mmetsp:Transcript_25114/g.32687  ORF Transcript_25114/g.32687 Transcript_25114/m.32687 type:complete len:483 (-) Transcript_25114:161-1609(-)